MDEELVEDSFLVEDSYWEDSLVDEDSRFILAAVAVIRLEFNRVEPVLLNEPVAVTVDDDDAVTDADADDDADDDEEEEDDEVLSRFSVKSGTGSTS